MELEIAATKLAKSEPFDIVNDEKQKEKRLADQFFRSLLGCRSKPDRGHLPVVRTNEGHFSWNRRCQWLS
jgi:hypothetical protein